MLKGLADLASQLMRAITTALQSINLDVGPFHLSGSGGFTLTAPTINVAGTIADAASSVKGAVGANGAAAPAPVVTNNTPITITQTFTGGANPAEVGAATHAAALQGVLRARGAS